MRVIGLHPPTDVVDSEGDGQQGDMVVDIPLQSLQSARGRIATDSDIDELHLAVGVTQQCVILMCFP